MFNTAIKIGFEQPSYTFIEPPSVEMFHVSLVKEGGRLSEQTFEVQIQVSDMTNPFLPASPGEDYNHPKNISVLFRADEEFVPWYFEIVPNQNPEENEAFHVQVSSVDFPHFLTSNSSLFTETLIVIKDSQSKDSTNFKLVCTCYLAFVFLTQTLLVSVRMCILFMKVMTTSISLYFPTFMYLHLMI